MDFVVTILYPIISLLEIVLELFKSITGSYGLAIILLSLFVSVITYPLSLYGQKVEVKVKNLHDEMDPRIKKIKEDFKGEKQFNEIEKVYKEYNYHPIYSVKSVAGFALQLPFLISCLLLLIDYTPLVGENFLFLTDISKPDSLISINSFSINVLPLLMASITLVETSIKPEMTSAGRNKFYFVTFGILILIYTLPSAVVLYWMTSNIISLLQTLRRRSLLNS